MFRLYVDSSNGVDIEPEYDFKENSEKIESRHRSRDGSEFVYKWGGFDSWKFKVMYVNSEFKSVVNSWWNSNAELKFKSTSDSIVHDVLITNKTKPIDQLIKPYTDLFKGQIDLGTY